MSLGIPAKQLVYVLMFAWIPDLKFWRLTVMQPEIYLYTDDSWSVLPWLASGIRHWKSETGNTCRTCRQAFKIHFKIKFVIMCLENGFCNHSNLINKVVKWLVVAFRCVCVCSVITRNTWLNSNHKESLQFNKNHHCYTTPHVKKKKRSEISSFKFLCVHISITERTALVFS